MFLDLIAANISYMAISDWTDDALEQLEGGVSQVKQKAKQAPSSIVKSVITQVTGKSPSDGHSSAATASSTSDKSADDKSAQAHQANTDMVRDMYAPSESQNSNLKSQNSGEQENGEATESQKAASKFIQEKIEDGMTPEEAQKIYSLRRQLHNEYYQKLINYSKQQPEERTAEKVEKEKEEDARMNLEEQKKKDTPIAVQMGANRTEKFPGASG